jgi:prenylcysteine oxidase/farnesylcysteine lyase
MLALATLLLVSSAACYGFQLPFDFPFFRTTGYGQDLSNTTSTPKIAIVGAGVGGTSAAFWISKAKERFGVDVEIDVYERESRIGGSEYQSNLFDCATHANVHLGTVSVHPYNDTNLPAIEIGPSTFSSTNKNLWRASQDFNLTRVSVHDPDCSLWDGEKILVTVSTSTLLFRDCQCLIHDFSFSWAEVDSGMVDTGMH